MIASSVVSSAAANQSLYRCNATARRFFSVRESVRWRTKGWSARARARPSRVRARCRGNEASEELDDESRGPGLAASPSVSTGDGSTADAAAPRAPRSWGASAGDDDLLAARADVDLFLRRVVKELIPLATSTVRSALGDAASDAVTECLLAGVDEATRGGAAELDAAVARIVANRCAAALKQMKGITATFRMTNKPLPTRHSHFVPGVSAPIRAFVESPAALLGVVDRL